MTDDRRYAPATARNRDAILDVLRAVLPPRGVVLEIASGSGEHALHFARALPHLAWQPSDPASEALASIAAWRAQEGPTNLLAPIALDASSIAWPIMRADAIVCINMIHISPWSATQGLLRAAGRVLPSGAPLVVYGPFLRADAALAPSNEAFDADLKARDPRWGLRDLDIVRDLAGTYCLDCDGVMEMPANNIAVVLRRR